MNGGHWDTNDPTDTDGHTRASGHHTSRVIIQRSSVSCQLDSKNATVVIMVPSLEFVVSVVLLAY